MQEKQTLFSGGLNNRLPAHMIPDGFSQDVKNADLTHGDFRPEKGEGTDSSDPAGSQYYYEAGGSWVGGAGFNTTDYGGLTFTNGGAAGSTTLICQGGTNDQNVTVSGPITVPLNHTLQISNTTNVSANNLYTLTVEESSQGFATATKFVEYADDLYISRDGFTVTTAGTHITNVGQTGPCQIEVALNDLFKFHIHDEVTSNGGEIPEGSLVTDINTANNKITLSKRATSTASVATAINVNCVPTRIMDGDLGESFQVGAEIPTPGYVFSDASASSLIGKNWVSGNTLPIPFRYALSFLDNTGVESGLSTPSGIGNATPATGQSTPLEINFTNIGQGKYLIYRIGDTSSVFKLLEYHYHNASAGATGTGVSSSPFTYTVTITDTGMPTETQYALRWYARNATSKAAKNQTDDKTSSGQTDFATSTNPVVYRNANADEFYIHVLCKIKGDTREYVLVSFETSGGSTTTGSDQFDYIDFQQAGQLAPLAPYESSGLPPKNIKFLTEVNSFFFASIDKILFISRKNQPNLWDLDATLTFDSQITGLGRRGSELIVFTQFGVFRVFGNAYDDMRKIQIPTKEGIPNGLHKTIAETRGGLVYANNNGLHYYNGSGIITITKNLVDSFTLPATSKTSNIAGVVDDQYFLLGPTSTTGWKLDMRDGSFRLSKTTLTANNLHYRGLTNRLYTSTGVIGIGSDLNAELQSKDFAGGDLNQEKFFQSIIISGTDFNGTVTPVIDGVNQTAFTISTTADLDRRLYLSDATRGNIMSVKTSGTGTIQEIGVDSIMANALQLSRFDSITFTYTGTPSVSVKIDGSASIASTTLSAPTGGEGQATLYFPAMTEGVVPHVFATETEANRITNYSIASEAI